MKTRASHSLLLTSLVLAAAAVVAGCDSGSDSTSSTQTTSTQSGGAGGSAGSGGTTGGSGGQGGGVGGANLACADDASLTEAEKSLIFMPADSWMEVPNSHFIDFCPAHEPEGAHTVSGCAAIINAWGGGVWDPVHKKMILWGGGHNDYWGNEVYGFSPQTFQWELLVPGTPVPTIDDLSEPMPDGSPDSRHTYDGLAYLTTENRLFAYGGALAPDGSSSVLTWALDLDQKAWSQLDAGQTLPPNPNGYYWMGTAYDEAGHQVWMRNESGVYVYDIAADTWERLIDAGFPPLWPDWAQSAYRRGVFDPKRKLFFTLGGKHSDGKPDFFAFDTVSKQPVYDVWQTTDGDEIAGGHAPGADHDPTADAIVAWAGGSAWALDLATKQWTQKSGAGAPAAQVENGTYGRFRYLSRYNVFILVNKPDENVYFYKHTGGCGR